MSEIPYHPAMHAPQFDSPLQFEPPLHQPPPVTGLGDPGAPYSSSTAAGQQLYDRLSVGDNDDPEPPVGQVSAAAAGADAEELATILAQPDLITLVSGRQVRVKPLKTRALLSLVGIAVGGVGPKLFDLDLKLDPDEDETVFAAKFAGLLISSALTSHDETLAFLRLVCEPVGLVTEGKIDKAVKARNQALTAALDAELEDPDPDDTISIIESIARNDGGSMQKWGKRLAGIWRLAERTGQIPASLQSRG